VPDTDCKLEIALEAYILQGNVGARFKPSVLLSREPVVQAFFEGVQLGERSRPCDLHGQVLECLATPSYICAALRRSVTHKKMVSRYIHELGEELTVEVICLRPIVPRKDSREKADFLDDEVFLYKKQQSAALS